MHVTTLKKALSVIHTSLEKLSELEQLVFPLLQKVELLAPVVQEIGSDAPLPDLVLTQAAICTVSAHITKLEHALLKELQAGEKLLAEALAAQEASKGTP